VAAGASIELRHAPPRSFSSAADRGCAAR
jgi:hypothetical protein